MEKLFLIDAFSLIYRSYFAFSKNPRITTSGLDTSAILGFTNTLFQLLKKEKPKYIGICFDRKEPTFRHDLFQKYKANREAQPEGITIALPYIKKILQAMQHPIFEKKGYEADDIIGTIAKSITDKNIHTYIFTSDKDFGQLVNSNISLYKPSFIGNKIEKWGVNEVLEKWRIENTEQVIDILGLQGDSIDNIPGVPGIGVKTAQKLLKKYKTIENIIENREELNNKKVKEKIETYKEQALLSKKLATIDTGVPIDFSIQELEIKKIDYPALQVLFKELEFKTLSERIFEPHKNSQKEEELFPEAQKITPTIEENTEMIGNFYTKKHHYYFLEKKEDIEELFSLIGKRKKFAFYLHIEKEKIKGISFVIKEKEAYHISQYAVKENIEQINKIWVDDAIIKIGYQIKESIKILYEYGCPLPYPPCYTSFFDIEVLHYILEAHKSHKLEDLAKQYLHYKMLEDKGTEKNTITDLICEKADILFSLHKILYAEIQKHGLLSLYTEIDAPLIFTLATMELNGVCLNSSFLKNYSKEIGEEIISMERSIFKISKETFNIDSPKQLGIILFEELKLVEKPKKTKTGQYATGEEILLSIAKKHPIVQMILDYRQLKKMKTTYIDALPQMVRNHLLHPSFQQTIAVTGRLSCNNPNLQNIPTRTEKGQHIRRAFIPRSEDYILMKIDYSQMELRVLAVLSQDSSMIDAFEKGEDIHQTTAQKLFDVPAEKVDKTMRRKAKNVNFGIVYGISSFGLAKQLNIPLQEAKKMIDAYFERFPSVREYINRILHFCKTHQYVETHDKRRRYIPEINSRNHTMRTNAERMAINTCVQGTAADIMKKSMNQIHQLLLQNKSKSKLTIQVHDELILDIFKKEKEFLTEQIKKIMEIRLENCVTFTVNIGLGDNWLEVQELTA